MVGSASRTHGLWMIVVLIALPARVGSAQIFGRVSHDAAAATNAACGFRPCPPKVLTYGYYHEHWRRWPEELSASRLSELSPFVVPDRTVPAMETPEPRDEASQVIRKRTPVPASPQDATAPLPGRSTPQAAPSGAAAGSIPPILPGEGTSPLDAELPGPADALTTPPSESNDLLLPDFPAGQESLPEVQPSAEPSTPSMSPGTDDVFDDLDSLDFGQSESDSMPPLSRAARLYATPPFAAPVAQASHVVELPEERIVTTPPDEEGTSDFDGRTNPLRPKLKAHYASQRKAQVAVPAAIRPSTAPKKVETKRTTGRSNPLRP